MRKEMKVILAGGIGLVAVLGIIGLRKFLERKQEKRYSEYYADFHRHFVNRYGEEDHHGVEFLEMQ